MRASARSAVDTYRAVVKGKVDNLQLLCANCHAIKTAMHDDGDGSLSFNLRGERIEAPVPLLALMQ